MERKIVEMLRAGKRVRTTAKELGVGRPRVREVRDLALAHGYLGTDPSRPLPPWPALLFPESVWTDARGQKTSDPDLRLSSHVDWIRERLIANWKPITVFEELPIKDVGRSSFYRFLNRYDLLKFAGKKIEPSERISPIKHEPGEALILDWGKVRDAYDPNLGRKRTLWAFVGVMGASRYLSVRLVWTNDVPTTTAALESMLKEIGGVPLRLTSDNPKCFALEASRFEPLLNPALERFSAHYGTTLECLPPADPQKKGKVERMMPFVRRLFEAFDWANWSGNLETAQDYINKKCTLANERVHGTTRLKPIEDFISREAPALRPLPALAFEIEEYSEPTVRRDGYIRFLNKYYAVDDALIGAKLQCLGTTTTLSIFHNGKLIECYERITSPHEVHATKDHLKKPGEKTIQDHGHYLKKAATLGPNVVRMVTVILESNLGFVDTRKIWGLLSLDKNYSAPEIDEACSTALSMNRSGWRVVRDLLQLKIPRPNIAQLKTLKQQGDFTKHQPTPPPKFGVEINDYVQSSLNFN